MNQDLESGMDGALKLSIFGLVALVIGVGLALGWGWALIILGVTLLVVGVVAFIEFTRQKTLVDREREFKQKELFPDG